MSATTAVNIDFVTQYKGSQNLKRAHSDMEKLGTAAKKLAHSLALPLQVMKLLLSVKHQSRHLLPIKSKSHFLATHSRISACKAQ